jgi:hypothetical protein
MVFIAMPAFAQQTGTISGKVVDQSGASMPGVTVEARSTVLPGPRTSVTSSNGSYQLAALPPGDYTVAFTLSGMQAVNRKVQVLLSQDVAVNVTMSVQSVSESVTVTAAAGYIEKTSAAINSTLSNQIFDNLPVGTEYRDLVKLIPGVQYTQDAVRGPSAGGSGQDNVYNFDGVNVTLPLFGTLASEPASHDIAQISVVKGGARAVDFNRAGGFSMDSVSKSGTSRFSGEASYRYQAPQMRAKLVTCAAATSVSTACNNQGKMYTDVNFGGPAVKDKLFFYGSYYQPHVSRENVSNAYGSLPNYSSNRYEGFGKVTLTPVKGLLLNASYRGSKRVDKSNLFGSFASVSTGTGNETSQRILTGDGSWIINDKSFISFKMTRFANPNQSRPDNESSALVSTAIGTQLDINALDTMGAFNVPLANSTAANAAAINAFRQTYINRYGYDLNGVKNGGGLVGYGSTFDKDDFFRSAGHFSYNLTVNTGDASRVPRGLPALHRRGRSHAQLERLGLDLGSGRTDLLQRHADLLPGGVPAADHGRHSEDPLGVQVAEHRVQRHDHVEEAGAEPRRARQQRHALRSGSERGAGHALGLHQGDGQPHGAAPLQDVRDSVEQDGAAAHQRDLRV